MTPTTRRRATLTRRLVLAYAATIVAIVAALAFVLDRRLQTEFVDDLTDSLVDRANAIALALPEDPQETVRTLGARTGVRITVIATSGEVLAESTRDPDQLDNHLDRPEVQAALRGEVGVSSRESESVGRPFRYVALPPEEDRIVRVALPLAIVEEKLGRVRATILGAGAVAALLGIATVWLIGRGLTRPLRRMTAEVARMSQAAVRIEPDGTAELAVLAEALNRLTDELRSRIDEIRDDRRHLDQILSSLEEGVALVRPSGTVAYANPRARDLLGGAPGEPVGTEPVRRLVEGAIAGGRPRTVELQIGLPTRMLEMAAIPLRDDVLLVVRDVTEAKRVEAMRREFVADASHELKTPVASIQAAAETVERAIDDDHAGARRFASQLAGDARRLSRIVSDLLDLSRLEGEGPAADLVDLGAVIDEEAARVRDAAGAAGVRVDVRSAPIAVRGSRDELALLVRNLLENAVRFTAGGGVVTIEGRAADGRATVTVADTGIGIPSRDLPRIFERFYRVDRARSRETGGTGLGLAIARHAAERHGGTIDVESELGRGSTFRVNLPLASDAA